MVFSSPIIVGVANVSADLCQYIACNPERLSSDEVLYLPFCFHVNNLGDLLFVYGPFLLPLPNLTYLSFFSSSSSSLSSDSDLDLEDSHPHAY
uniref:Putative ovule protein n=1 Tax=Solanum chacoense TaxID=4108 RepID=A0A0V0GL76_SOLCH